jgi:two-component system LytT family sensor kinase
MHTAIKTLLISLLIGLSFGLYLFFTYDHTPLRIFSSVLSAVSIGSLMLLVISFRHYLTIVTAHQTLKVIIIIALLAVAALLGTEITLLLRSLLSHEQYEFFTGGSVYILNILIVMVTGIPIYISEEWKTMLNTRLLNQQYRVLQLEQQQAVFELELLRAKINPHFLYNVHNTVAGLISKDPSKAEELVLLLSKFFRFSLNKNSATFHSITDELDIIKTYLHMQQIRFEDRMSYTIRAEPAVLDLQIPSFILQPIIENAVKHGIEPSAENGSVSVALTADERNISIIIADSGPAFPDKPGTGHGLQMVMSKLRLLYSDDFKMELNNHPQKYVHLILPRRN